ncbi:ABC transporter substrate-binding protein/permease [Nocardioides nematodiphilus]|uniref:ABC transporter substrate-binding protein/permease n=1 Tax=Nocardioides nematodiphilus TaxID=2849669 RepID=UPI001CD98A60|nr:ABC transporter substrate-binding protein/permease [Nocardioides nematodiphilus]MCA1982219.1 ABC transporter substrate-binding protein/permease [Nocardioides nematodiphilus]
MRRVLILLVLLLGAILAMPAIAPAASAADAPSRPVVRVGTEGTYPPFSYIDPKSGEVTGFDIEVARAVAAKAGWDLKIVRGTFDSLFPAMDAGRIDMIANQITINPDREAHYLFSTPYTYSHGVIVTAAGTDDITTLADLKGRTAAQSQTSNWTQVAKDAGAKVQYVDQFSQTAALLAQGRVDATINDNIAVLDYLATSGSTKIKIAGDAGDEVNKQALVFPKSDSALRDQADAALAALKADGTLARISQKYFKSDVTVPNAGQVHVKGSDVGRSTAQVVRDAAWPMLRGTLKGTIPLTIVSFVVGLLIALLAALARISSSWWVRAPARVYISIIRGTPLLVQLFIVFYGLPELGVDLPSFPAACLALSLNVGGYAAEIIRASILAVPRGQFEAATTIGMGYARTMRRIVLPQAARIAVPPLSNTLLSLIKDTSLASVVLMTELFREAQVAASVSTRFMALYCLAALYYWIICYVVSLGQNALEKRVGRYAV